MALNHVANENEVTSEKWVKIADLGQKFLLQIQTYGRGIVRLKSFNTLQDVNSIPKTDGTRLDYGDEVTQDDFDGYVYIIASKNSAKYDLHREQ